MSGEVEELFEGGSAARPRWGFALGVLGAGVALTLLGLACSSVPGGLVTLWGYFVVEKEIDRVDTGYLPVEDRPALLRLRALAWACLALVLGTFVIQGVLLCSGAYVPLWAAAIELLRPIAEWAAAQDP
jgi:hypothetical protein